MKDEEPAEGLYQPLTPVYGREEFAGSLNLSAAVLPDAPTPADSTYQIIKNELLMDAQPGLNLATFCNEAYSDPWGERVVHDSVKKNFIDHTEYPGTQLAERRCIRMLARELGADFEEANPATVGAESEQGFYGTATIGSSEAVMLGLIAHKFIWNLKHRVLLDHQRELGIRVDPRDRPVVLMSSQVHGCWDKFCRYYDAVSLYVECEGPPYAVHDGRVFTEIMNTDIDDPDSRYAERIRTAIGYEPGSQEGRTIGELVMAVGACVGTTFTGNSDDVPSIDDAVDDYCRAQNEEYSRRQQADFRRFYQETYRQLHPEHAEDGPTRIPRLGDIPIHVDAASSGFVLAFSSGGSALKFNFKDCPKRVLSINVSNHKFGMTFTGMGSVVFKDNRVVDRSLVYDIAYLGGNFIDYTVNFSRGSAMIVMQYYNFLRFGRQGYRAIMDNCVANTRWFVEQLKNHELLNATFKNVSNLGMGPSGDDTIYLPIIALTWRLASDKRPTWDLVDMSDKLAQRGWVVPAYNIPRDTPEDTEGIQVLRIVVQQVVTRNKLGTLIEDMDTALKHLNRVVVPQGSTGKRRSRRTKCLC